MEGNQMKMREALLTIKEVSDRDMRHHVSMSETDQTSIRAWSNLFVSLVDSALAEPPRNCDVGTAEEQDERFHEFCSNHWGSNDRSGNNCGMCPLSPINCLLEWAQMPYEAEGGAK